MPRPQSIWSTIGPVGTRVAHAAGAWQLIGPSKATYPAVLNPFLFDGAQYVASGRVTAMAIGPSCKPGACPLYVAAAEKQGRDIRVLEVRHLIAITDYFVILSGSSDRQVKTLADEVVRELKARGVRPVRREGEVAARWVLLDFVDFVVHVFHPTLRDFYQLERLWSDAESIPIEAGSRATA